MKIVLSILLVTCATAAFAAGSIDFSDIRAILQKQPEYDQLLVSALEVDTAGWGVRLGRHFEHLGGSRIGPYSFKAKPRGVKGPFTLDVTICTATTFVDDSGRPTKDIRAATGVIERVTSVIIREANVEVLANCPNDSGARSN